MRGCVVTGPSPSSTPSAKSPGPDEEEEQEPPQLSVKREFSISGGKRAIAERDHDHGVKEDEEESQQNNLLDCLVQAQSLAIQQAAGNKNFENNINNFSPQHLMSGEPVMILLRVSLSFCIIQALEEDRWHHRRMIKVNTGWLGTGIARKHKAGTQHLVILSLHKNVVFLLFSYPRKQGSIL